jgi:hypothetical protein
VVRRAQARPAVAARQRRLGGQGVRGVGVGGDAAADAGARRRRLLRPVDGALAHSTGPRRRHAGGEKRLGTACERHGRYRVLWEINLWPRICVGINEFLARLSQEVNEMWAGLGYYRRARFLLEVSCTLLGSMGNRRLG